MREGGAYVKGDFLNSVVQQSCRFISDMATQPVLQDTTHTITRHLVPLNRFKHDKRKLFEKPEQSALCKTRPTGSPNIIQNLKVCLKIPFLYRADLHNNLTEFNYTMHCKVDHSTVY